MNFKYLFLIVCLLGLVSNVNAFNDHMLNYQTFETKAELINFLEQANDLKLDLRSDSETSRGIKEQTNQYGIDLRYYNNLQLYDSIFSKFSWWLTGFAIGDLSDKTPNLEISERVVVSGQEMSMGLTNLKSLNLDKLVVLMDEQIIEVVKFDDSVNIGLIVSNSWSLGDHVLSVKGTDLKQKFEIRKKELNIDPILKLSAPIVKEGDTLTFVGANIPLKESELDTLNVLANDKVIEVLQYPSQGVFKFDQKVNLIPGKYIISLENLPSTSTNLVVEIPFREPKIILSENFIIQGDKLIIFGENFQKEANSLMDLVLYGPSEMIIGGIQVNELGKFERFISTTNLNSGEYKIFSKEYNTVSASFKLILPEIELPIITTDLMSVEQGKSITLIGESFEEGSRISLSLDGISVRDILCNDQGKFNKKIDTSNLFIGTHKVFWKENSEVSVPFNVEKKKPLPQLKLGDIPLYVGEEFNVYGSNFFDESVVRLYVDNFLIGTVFVDKQGNFITSVNPQFEEGAYKLIVKNKQGDILTIAVLNLEEKKQAVMKVLTEPIYSSGDFKIKGFFFEPGNIILKLDNFALKKFNIWDDGCFEGIISLKNFENSPGVYKLLAEQNNEIKAFSTLNILKEKPDPLVKIQNEIVYENSILNLNGKYFENEKIGIRIDNIFNDNIFISESGNFEYSVDLSMLKLSAGTYELNVGGIFLPLNIQGRVGPILKTSEYELFIGDSLVIYGDNFESTEELMLIIDDSFLYELNSSKFSQIIDTKEVGLGLHKVRVQGYEPVVSFNVKDISSEIPILKISPDEVFLGDKIIVKGFNFDSSLESLILKIKSLNLDKIVNFEDLSEDRVLSYTIYPINGNFELILNSNELGVGHHEININEINYGFSITSRVSPSLNVLNQTIIQGKKLTLMGNNFPIMTTMATNKLIIDKEYYGPIAFLEGSFKTQISTDNLDVGYHEIGVESYNIVVGFMVNPKIVQMPEIRLSHQVATKGVRITITGSKFPSSSQEMLNLELPGGEIKEIMYPLDKSFLTSWLVCELIPGEHFVSVEGFNTAVDSFIYQGSGLIEPEMILSETKARVGDDVQGVVNGLPLGIISVMDIRMGGKKVGELESSGIGSAVFKFMVPNIDSGMYLVGLAGINFKEVELEVLPKQVPQKIEKYSDKEIKEIKQEVIVSFLGDMNINLVENDALQVAEIQDREVRNSWISGLVSANCVPQCSGIFCGQKHACGGFCSSKDLNVEGKCGNPVKSITNFDKTAEKLSKPVNSFFKDWVFLR